LSKLYLLVRFIILFLLPIGLIWTGCGEEDSINLPTQPVNVQATVEPGHVSLEWTLPENGQHQPKFNVYRQIVAENESNQIAVTDQRYYQDFSVAADTSYFYYISTVETQKGQKVESQLSKPIRIDFFQPKLVVEPAKLDLGVSGNSVKFSLQNHGLAILNWTIEQIPDWLSLDITKGFINPDQSETITANVDRSIQPDLYQFNLNISVTGSESFVLPVFFEIAEEPTIWLSTTEIQFGHNDNSKNLVLKNSGTGTLDWSIISPETWLIVEPTRGQINTETMTVRLAVDRGILSSGMTNTQLTLSTGNGQILPISVNISTSRPILALSTKIINFGTDSQRKTVILRNEGLVDLFWRLSPPKPRWLQTIPSSGKIPPKSSVEVGLIFDRSWVIAGQHRFKVKFSSSPSTEDFPIQSLDILAQRKGKIFGLVRDGRTGQPLSSAEIYLPPYREISRPNGKFVLPFDNEGKHQLNITANRYIGRRETVQTVFGEGKIIIDLSPIPRITDQIFAGNHLSHPIRIAFSNNSIYVTNERHHPRLTVIERTMPLTSIRLNEPETILKGEHPVGIAIAKDKICLALSDIDKISIMTADNGREIHRFTVGDYPVECVASKDGRWLYVSLQRENRVAVVDLNIPARVQKIVVGSEPSRLLIRKDILYVCNYGDGTVSAVDLNSRREILRIRVGQLPTSLTIAENGRYLYVVNSLSDDLSIIDLKNHREVDRPSTSTSPVAISALCEPSGRELVYVGDQNGSVQIYELIGQGHTLKLSPHLQLNTDRLLQDMKYDPNQQKLVILGKRQITIFGYD